MNPSAEWQLSPGGRSVVIAAAESPANGKIFIRANGRVVGPPLAPGERERLFAFEGRRYRLRRDAAGALQLDELDPAPVVEPRATPALVLPKVKETPRRTVTREPYLVAVAIGVMIVGTIHGFIAVGFLNTMRATPFDDVRAVLNGADEDLILLVSQLGATIRGGLIAQAVLACITTSFGILLLLGAPRARLVIQCTAWAILIQVIETCAISDRLLHEIFFRTAVPAQAVTLLVPMHRLGWFFILLGALACGILLHEVRKIEDVSVASALAG